MDSALKKTDPEIWDAIHNEILRQGGTLELIASENFVSDAVLEALGSVMTNKYAEGYPGKRYYGGCEYVDIAENLARDRAKQLFGCDHVNVQPHSGTQANMTVYLAALNIGDTFMGLNLSHGGHLSHGHPVNFSGKYFHVVQYSVEPDTEVLDYDKLMEQAKQVRPKLIMAGASAYPRTLDFAAFRRICDEVGAFLAVDIAHIAGLIVAGLHPSPIPYADFVTTTTHKTLRGPRGGMVMCREEHAQLIDKTVFPGIQGGPLMHVIAAKAVAFQEALQPAFKDYQKQIVKNAAALAEGLKEEGVRLVSGGTDTHLMLADMRGFGLTGKVAEIALESVKITVNKNTIPYDPEKPFVTSGVRLGTPAVTSRGMKEPQMKLIANLIARRLRAPEDETVAAAIKSEVDILRDSFPLYRELL